MGPVTAGAFYFRTLAGRHIMIGRHSKLCLDVPVILGIGWSGRVMTLITQLLFWFLIEAIILRPVLLMTVNTLNLAACQRIWSQKIMSCDPAELSDMISSQSRKHRAMAGATEIVSLVDHIPGPRIFCS